MRYENGKAIIEGPKVIYQPQHKIVVSPQRTTMRGQGERVRAPRTGPRFNAVCMVCYRFASGASHEEAFNRLNETACEGK